MPHHLDFDALVHLVAVARSIRCTVDLPRLERPTFRRGKPALRQCVVAARLDGHSTHIMRTKLKITEGIFPMPVLMVATYNEDGSVNVMNAAWGTMQEQDTVALNLTKTHKTVQNIKARGAFTVSIADAAHMVEADYFGVESGNKVADKFARSGLTASKAETVDAPVINEFPICLECKFIEYQNNKYGCGVIGKVVNVTADESVMVDGKIDMSKVNAIAFDPYTHGYYKVTERVGEAFHDGLKLKK